MEWYKIILIIPIIILGAYLRGKIYEHKNGYYRKDKKK
jgi:hypothetical protein